MAEEETPARAVDWDAINEATLQSLRKTHGHLPPDEFFELALSMNVPLPADSVVAQSPEQFVKEMQENARKK